MKSAAFDYVRADDLDEAAAQLAVPGTVPLAGGQSLLPLMARRRVRPARVCDLNRVSELSGIEVTPEAVRVGAMVRQRDLETHSDVSRLLPVVPLAISSIGFVATRHRGTVGGSLCFADPCAELPAMALALDARLTLRHGGAEREVAAADFFTTAFGTVLADGEFLAGITLPVTGADRAGAVKLRAGQDRPLGCQVVWRDEDGLVTQPRVVLFGQEGPPLRLTECEEVLRGRRLQPGLIEEAADTAPAGLTPPAGSTTDSSYRRGLARAAIARALRQAVEVHDV